MQNFRPLLIIAWLFAAFLLWQSWNEFNRPPAPPQAPTPTGLASDASRVDVPTAGNPPSSASSVDVPDAASAPIADAAPVASSDAGAPGQLVTVETDVLRLVIDSRGGSVVSADLLAYPVEPRSEVPVQLLSNDPTRLFWAQSGIVSRDGNAPDHNALYQVDRERFQLQGDVVEVPFTWQGSDGISVRKVYVLRRGDYAIGVRHEIRNDSAAPWTGNVYRQLQRVPLRASTGFSFTDVTAITFHGAAWYSPGDGFEKLKFEDFQAKPQNKTITGGWAGMLQHYFFAAWIPAAEQSNDYATARVPNSSRHLVRQVAVGTTIAPGSQAIDESRLWIGPKSQNVLPDVAPGLERTIDYGMFTFLSKPLFWVLDQLHSIVRNWGLAIILITVLIKLAFYRLSKAQYVSMARMRKLQPRLAQLKERYGDDRQKLNAAMMEMYKKEKINPLGGCLPILLQIPVFIALYWVLLESVELRQAPFMLWIQDLSARDPYFVLPVLNGAVMWLTQKLSPAPGVDPIQRRIFQAMPIVFSVMFAFFPAGLVLYWLVNGALGLLQQWWINKQIESGKLK